MLLPINTDPLHKLGTNKRIGNLVSFSMEARRLALLGKRLNNVDTTKYHPTDQDPFSEERRNLASSRQAVEQTYSSVDVNNNKPLVTDYVSLIDIDYGGPDEGWNEIRLPFIPKELNWDSQSNFVAIKPIGRNNPKYHFTGSEDNLEFEIDWHSMDNNRDDVIKSCRAIESLTKNDGYLNPPHRVILKWGEEDVLFRDIVFIVTSAPYRMVRFNKSQMINNQLQKTAMLPVQAYQKVTLSRLTPHNLSHRQISKVHSTKYY